MKQKHIERELAMELAVGAFMVAAMVGMFFFTVVLSRDVWFSKKYAMQVRFDQVMGLRDGDNVVVRGMPVGKIKTLELRADGVYVTASLDEPVEMRDGYSIQVVNTSMLGGRHMAVEQGPSAAAILPPDTMFSGQVPRDLMSDAAEAVYAMKQGLVEGGVITNLQGAAREMREIAARLNAGEGTLGKLLSSDDQLYRDLSAAVASLREITGRLESGEGTLGKLLSTDDRVYQDLSALTASLRTMADDMRAGKGTMGRLFGDESLYVELMKAITELRGWIDDSRETSPVVNFSTIFFGAF